MSQAWVLVWLPLVAPPTAAETQLLDAWARHENVEVRQARSATVPTTARYSSAIVSHIEESLENARVALDASDPIAAAEHAHRARTTLTEHPELPQAAWLMAETLHLTAASAWALGDEAAARSALRDAQGLEASRAAALDDAFARLPNELAGAANVQLTLRGTQPGDKLEWDGEQQQAEGALWSVPSASELHHVRVLREARPLWTGWVRVSEGAAALTLTLPQPEPCSARDLDQARQPESASRVRCANWLAARPAVGGAIEVARCRLGRCDPFERWPRPAPSAALREREGERPAEANAWAAPLGYTFLGVAVAAAATALIVSATREDEPERTVWVYEGIR